MAASFDSRSPHEDEDGEEESNNQLQSLLDQSDALILSCLRRKAREDKNFLFWDFSPSEETEDTEPHEPVVEVIKVEPTRTSPLIQVTLYLNGYSLKLLVSSNGNSSRNGDSGNEEVFLPYEDSFNPESDLLQYLDMGQTPPALVDLLQLRFPERINQIECRYGQEVEVLVKDFRHAKPECSKDSLTTDTQFRLRSSDVTMMKVIRQKVVTLNHEKRRMNLNLSTQEASGSKGKGKNLGTAGDQSSLGDNSEPKPKGKNKRKRKPTKNLDATPEEIESQVIHDCSEPLCLDPSPLVCLIENKLVQATRFVQYSHEIMKFTRRNMNDFNRKMNKRMKRLQESSSKDDTRGEEDDFVPLNVAEGLTSFLAGKSELRTPATIRANKKCKSLIGSGDYQMTSESVKEVDIEKTFAEITKIASRKALASSLMNRNFTDNSLIKVEEYLMEFDVQQNLPPIKAGNVQQQLAPPSHGITAVSIFHRPVDDTFFGQLFVDKPGLAITDRSNWNEALRSSSSSRSCLFKLGSRENAKAYLEQFTEILSENGRKSVRITRSGVGAGIPQIQQPRQNSAPSAQQQPQQQQQHQIQQKPQPTSQQIPQQMQPPQQQQPQQIQMHQTHQIPIAVGSSTLPVAAKVQLQPIQAANVQVIAHQAPLGTKVILPAPVQQIQPIPNNVQQQHHHAQMVQMVPTPIAPAPPAPVQVKSQASSLGNVSLCSLLQQPIQVVPNAPTAQLPPNVIPAPLTIANQIQPRPVLDVQGSQLNAQQQQQLIQTLQQSTNQNQHLTAALDSCQMRPGQSWIVLPPNNNMASKNVTNSTMIAPGQTVTTVPVSQAVNINQTFRPFQVILWPQQQQQTVNVQPIPQSQNIQATTTGNGSVAMTLAQVQQQQIQQQIQQQQQSHP